MQKTIILSIKEFKTEFERLVTDSSLPASILCPIMQNYVTDLKSMEKQEFSIEQEKYEKAMSEEILENESIGIAE